MSDPATLLAAAAAAGTIAAGGAGYLATRAHLELVRFQSIGGALHKLYDRVVDEGTPPEMLELLERLDGGAAEGEG